MGARPASCMGSQQGCLMFNCLIHLWEWLDPPVVTSSPTSMDRLKGGTGAQQPLMQAQSPTTQQAQSAAGGNAPPHRRPLLEPRERRELYGATRPPPPPHLHPHHQHQHQHPRSPVHPEHQPVPPGYNVDIHNAYLRRTAERQQIYQNHCNVVYRQPEAETSYPRLTQPPSNTDLLRQQYNEIQQMKLQQQMHYQNQAQMQQQQVFAQRQLMLQQLHGLKVPSNVQTPLHHMDFGQQIQSLELHQRNFEPEYNRPRKIGAVAPLSPGPNSPEASTTGLKSPSSSEGRRSSGSSSTVLKSPVAQRLSTAPVAMSGWLYKQGSDGLKVWRKRWFVLTEYCLFYYKNHEEDKLLGSILLPSYTVSACTPDERVGKKYAFKCEHANMRTYVLAAMDQDTMNRWIRTLTMASIMQEGSSSDKSVSSRTNTTPPDELAENDHSGIGQPTYANAPPKPRRSNEGYGSPSPERYDPNYDLLRKPSSNIDHQLNNTTSPVNAQIDNIYDNKYRSKIPSSLPSNRHTNEPTYNAQNLSLLLTNTSTDRLDRPSSRHPNSYRDAQTKSPMSYGDRHSKMPEDMNNENMINSDGFIEQQNDNNQQEGLTPESYGRSPIIPGYYNSKGRMTDYEDIYNLNSKNATNSMEMSYERPLSPNLYGERRTPMQHTSQRYTPSNVENESNGIPLDIVRRKKSPSLTNQSSSVPRPHSADFLEYESANPQHNVHIRKHGGHPRREQPPRPKSSLDINSRYDHASDNLYYSEASYAEKMRQSALYLQNKGNSLLTPKNITNPDEYQGNPFNGSYNYESDLRSRADGRSSTERSITDTKYTDSATNSSWSVKEKANAVSNQIDNYNRSNSAMSEGVMSVNSNFNQELAKNESNDIFMRSASARLPSSLYEQLESADGENKVHQREESMKRLLEWKQRMLQSPLTRKSIPSSLILSRNLNQTKLATYQQTNSDHQQKYNGQTFPKATAKFASHINNSYNSFSSDDEECIASEVVSERDSGHLQAGRSHTPTHTDTAANSSSLQCSHLSDSDDTKTLLHLSNENLNSNKDIKRSESLINVETDRSTGTLTKNDSITVGNSTQNLQNATEEMHNSDDSDFHMEYTDNDLDEVLIESEDDSSVKAIQSGRKSVLGKKYDEEKDESDREELTLNENDSDMKQRSRQATPRPETPPKKSYEDFYLPMSPRKEILAHEPGHRVFNEDNSVFDDVSIREDNPYVEMTQGKGIENVFQSEELQTYELVCVNNTHTEPVYMEVSHGDEEADKEKESILKEKGKDKITETKSILRRSISADPKANSKSRKHITSPLPDILMGSTAKGKFIKSDSSDADDEASKDFSMDAAYSRFSLSDTFRPASYYLGPSRLLGDLQDSSDSEIVSPPPIPLDDLDIPLSIQDYKKCMETPLMSQLIKSSEMAQAEKNGTLKKKSTSLMICGATPSMHDTIFRGERVKRNRASLPSDKKSKEDIAQPYISSNCILPLRNLLENTETESILSYNADRGSSRMSIDSSSSNKFEIDSMDKLTVDDQQIELRHSQMSFNDDIEKMLKRRPLSDESFFEIQSLEGGINETIDLDQYLSELENSKVELYSNNTSLVTKCQDRDEIGLVSHDDSDNSGYINERIAALRVEAHYENVKMQARSKQNASVSSNESLNMSKMLRPASRMSFSSILSDRTNRHSQTRKDSVGMSSYLYSNESHSTPQSATHSRQTSFDHSSLSYYSKNLSAETTVSLEKNLNESINSDLSNKVKSFETEKVVKISPERKLDTYKSSKDISHSRESSTDHSAPYYYSDLSSQEHINVTPSAPHFSKNTNMTRKLNNQRRKGPVSKKTEITHIHNPIHPNVALDQAQKCEEPFKIAEAARSVSVEFLSVSDKLLDIDSRNIYESSTLKRQKVRDSISSLHSNHSSKNIYPSVSHDKTSSCDATMIRQNTEDFSRLGERTQSLNGFLDHIPGNNILSDPNLNGDTGASSQYTNNRSESRNEEQINSLMQMPISSETTLNDVNDNSSIYAPSDRSMASEVCEADEQWDEDTLWRENLRRASHRHAKSMDDLDCLSLNTQKMSGRSSVDLNSMIRSSGCKTESEKSKMSKIIRGVTYVNDNVKSQRTILNKRKLYRKSQKSCKAPVEIENANVHDENDVYVELALGHSLDSQDDGVYEQLVVEKKDNPQSKYGKQKEDEKKKFEIDREKLRQWDLMSSGLMKNESCVGDSGSASVASTTGGTNGTTRRQNDTNHSKLSLVDAKNEASMSTSGKGIHLLNRQLSSAAAKKPFMGSNPSLGRATRETIPVRAVSPRIRWTQQDQNGEVWNQQSNQPYPLEENWSGSRASLKQPQQPVRVVSPRIRRVIYNEDVSVSQSSSNSQSADVEQLLSLQSITAGELLGRTHEELVLLLIQLRRRHMATANSIEQTALQIHNIQDNFGVSNASERQENLQRLEILKQQLFDLEKEYQKSKPLVHLVDNMVKLGSLYNRPGHSLPSTIDRIEYNQQLRQKMILKQQEDQRRWAESLSSLSASEVQERVDELWALHRQAAGEAATLRSLQRDHLLSGVRSGISSDPLQGMSDDVISPAGEDGGALEADLSRVHMMLAQNSKKLEQTVADNARLERELMALRQKLHKHRISETSQTNNANNNFAANNSATALLEDEVVRVQALVSHLQSQRQLLAAALRSPQAINPQPFNFNATPTQHNFNAPKQHNYYPHASEMVIPSKNLPKLGISPTALFATNPIGINIQQDIGMKKRSHSGWMETDLDSGAVVDHPEYGMTLNSTLNTPLFVETAPDDLTHQSAFGNLTNVEKQEIKTVRIVKRESERRQRERSLQPDWSIGGNSGFDQLMEEDFNLAYYGGRGSTLNRAYQSNQHIDASKQQLEPASLMSPTEGKKFPSSPSLSTNSLNDYAVLDKSISGTKVGNGEVSPIFKSEAAREILMEISGVDEASSRRRAIPKVKRRHNTAPHHLSTHTLNQLNREDTAFYQDKVGRSLDDADLERVLRGDRPREVVRGSAAPATHFSTSTIDQLLAAPTKIFIPERYVPEQAPELSPEEEKKRREKVESIRKMLSSTSNAETGKSPIDEDKKQREHLLQLNRILAKQVVEMSKIVAIKAMEKLPLDNQNCISDESSPEVELPIYQQRYNYFS